MKNIVIILFLLFIGFSLKAQIFNPKPFNLSIVWKDTISRYSFKRCVLNNFNENSITIYIYNPDIDLIDNYDITKLYFSDLESLKIGKHKNIIFYTLGCAAGGALIGGIIGAVIGDSKCKGSGSALLGAGIMCGWEEAKDGFWIGMLSGGLTGIYISSVKVNIPLEKNKTKQRNKRLRKMKY